MNQLVDSLWHEVRNRLERLPVWLPGTPMELGDVGVLDDGGWSKSTTLDALGIGYAVDAGGTPVDYDCSSYDGAQVHVRLAAPLDPVLTGVVGGNIGMRVDFSRQGAFVLRAKAVAVRRITNVDALDEQILSRYEKKIWRREWIVVTEVAEGGPSVMLVSGGTSSGAVVDLGVAVAGVDVVGADCRLGTASGLAASFIGAQRMTLLWRGRCVHSRWWSRRRWLDDRQTPSEDGIDPGGTDLSGTDPGGTDPGGTDPGGDGTGGEFPEIVDIEYPEDLPPAATS
ncbi:hypothetical protein GCM10023322_57130 [Rugosimonospora acidiphila]|uniref:Uncharacterized protein n=1 Tax=Rugosimonospora acidiphila TaxID=556531 RepID=A0ABP9SE68_9ACTN